MSYIQNIVSPFVLSGYRVGVIHARGVSNTPLMNTTCHYERLYPDLVFGLEHVFAKYGKQS